MHISLFPKLSPNTYHPLSQKMFPRNWLVQPPFFHPMPNTHRIVLNCFGYSPKSIHTEVQGNILVVVGNESIKTPDTQDYSIKQFRKTIQLPENLDNDKLKSFMTLDGRLIIDIPFKKNASNAPVKVIENDLFPRISDDKKSVSMNIALPKNIDPAKLEVKSKDGHLVVKYQDKKEEKTDSGYSKAQVSFYKRILLPKNTDFTCLKHKLEKNKLSIVAPLLSAQENKTDEVKSK